MSKCGAHSYNNIDKMKVDAILDALVKNGSTISGTNPWTVDTKNHGVILLGTWDAGNALITVEVVDKDFYVPCSKIWDAIDPVFHHIASLASV